MSLLRDKDNGCEWDKEQTFETIAPYTIEEAYEVADAIERSNITDLKEELGDLLLQVVFLSQIAKEEQSFEFNDVVETITEKLIRRHPYVFSNKKQHSSVEQLNKGRLLFEIIVDFSRSSTGLLSNLLSESNSSLSSLTVAISKSPFIA